MNQKYNDRCQKILADFPKGTVVCVKDPDQYILSVANKIRDRLGEIVGHQIPTPNPIVVFYAVGRKKEYRHVFTYPDSYLEIVSDPTKIATWRKAVELKAKP